MNPPSTPPPYLTEGSPGPGGAEPATRGVAGGRRRTGRRAAGGGGGSGTGRRSIGAPPDRVGRALRAAGGAKGSAGARLLRRIEPDGDRRADRPATRHGKDEDATS